MNNNAGEKMANYYLNSDIYTCIAGGHIVFLSAKKDVYIACPSVMTNYMSSIVDSGVLDVGENYFAGDQSEDINQLIVDLLNNKILTRSEKNRKNFGLSQWVAPKKEFPDGVLYGSPVVKMKHKITFIRSLLMAAIGVKAMGFYRLIRHVSKYKLNKKVSKNDEIGEAIYAFREIRSFFYTGKNHCYFDCAVMMYYLLNLGYDPNWIFGVSMEPFEAHCWVQVGDAIVTDELSAAMPFSVIMSI